MSNANINLNTLTAKTVLASTFSQASYMTSEQLKTYTPPAGFIAIEDKTNAATGFSAATFVNKTTGEVVIAYRGSDTVGEAVGVAARAASTGTWDPEFTDATNYAAQAKAAALDVINKYRFDNNLDPLESKDLTPLVTGHSLGGLLGEVVSKMFGWPAEVFDSLGGGKLVGTKEYNDQAKALGQVDADGNPINHDMSDKITNYAKGVAAAAFRMEPDSKGPNCGWGGNPKACKVEMRCVLELYFDRQAHVLPWDMRMWSFETLVF